MIFGKNIVQIIKEIYEKKFVPKIMVYPYTNCKFYDTIDWNNRELE